MKFLSCVFTLLCLTVVCLCRGSQIHLIRVTLRLLHPILRVFDSWSFRWGWELYFLTNFLIVSYYCPKVHHFDNHCLVIRRKTKWVLCILRTLCLVCRDTLPFGSWSLGCVFKDDICFIEAHWEPLFFVKQH